MTEPEIPESSPVAATPVDALIAAAVICVAIPLAITRRAATWVRSSRQWRNAATLVDPLIGVALRPPGVPERFQAGSWISTLSITGLAERTAASSYLDDLLDRVIHGVLAEVLRRADLTDLVVRYVDLNEVVASVDLDRAVARVDLNRAVTRVDVNAIASKLDLDAVASRLDVNAVAARLDLDAVIDRLDLTALVLERVDLELLVATIIGGMDLVGLAQEVIDGVDLPEIIRESTGAMASDTVRGARMQGIAADEAITRIVDRLLLHRGSRPAVGGPSGNGSPPAADLPAQRAPSRP